MFWITKFACSYWIGNICREEGSKDTLLTNVPWLRRVGPCRRARLPELFGWTGKSKAMGKGPKP